MSTDETPLRGRAFRWRSLAGSTFHDCDLSGVVVRGSDVSGMEVDSPWLFDQGGRLVVNGVDVVPLVDAELDRRFPGRSLRTAAEPAGLREAWAALEQAWAATLERATSLPPDVLTAQVDGEWSFLQTLRHLVMATDVWLGHAVLRLAEPYHPVGLPHDDGGEGSPAYDPTVFSAVDPTPDEVLAARADRQRSVREFLATLTPDVLAETRPSPHAPEHEETVLACLRTILDEEWEHHRYAVRDLERLAGA